MFSTSLLSRKSNKGTSASSSLRSSSNQTSSPSQSLPPSHAVSYEELGHRPEWRPSSQTSSSPLASGKPHRRADGNKRTSRSSTLSSTSSGHAVFPAPSMYKNTELDDQACKTRFPGDKPLDLDPPHGPRACPVSRARPTPRCHGCSDSAGRQQCAVKCVHMVKACTACSKKYDAGDR